MKIWAVIIFLLLPFVIKAQIISTFAGGGTGGTGSPATDASIPDPIGGVFDKYGNYYCADGIGNIISKVSNTGIYTIIAGNGTSGFTGDDSAATSAELYVPSAVKIDSTGNIYISDAGNNRIRKVNATTGIITTIAGCSSAAGFSGDNGPAILAKLNDPQDIFLDKTGNIYIADSYNARIRKIDTSGIITTIAGTGIGGYTGDNGPATAAEIKAIYGLAMDDTGNLYIAGGNVVRKINPSGIITTVAGINGMNIYSGNGIAATDAPMSPIKIVIDPLGQLIIADNINYRVFRVNLAGIIYTIAGNGVAGFSGDGGSADSAEFDYPAGVTFDSCGNLYITDVDAGRVREVAFNPECWPLQVPQIIANEVVIYPNPAYDIINIDNIITQTNYTLLNITGNMIQSGTLKPGNNSILVQSIPPGLYLLEMINEAENKTIKKIVKE